MRFAFAFLSLMFCSGAVFAQSTATKPENEKKEGGNATSLEPYYPKEKQVPKKAKKKSSKKSGATYESEQQYYERMARVVKEKQKAEKEMEKPQYSNPMYFGHKRPPKKRKAGKLKFCKECGIRH